MGAWKELLIFCKSNDLDPAARSSHEAFKRGWAFPRIDDDRDLTMEEIAELTGGKLGETTTACPYCGSGKPHSHRLRIERYSPNFATWECFYCSRSGSVETDDVDPVREAELRDRAAALRAEQEAESTERALKLWEEAKPLPPIALTYFHARCIFDLPPRIDDVLRWHPYAPFGKDGRMGSMMLALFRTVASDEPVAVHRTWILDAERGIADRTVIGPFIARRSAIKLWPLDDTGRLVIAEGIETTLAAAGSRRLEEQVGESLKPAWAFTVARNLRLCPAIRKVRRLVILSDNDTTGTGQDAALAVQFRWEARGRSVRRFTPSKADTDFNDVVREMHDGR